MMSIHGVQDRMGSIRVRCRKFFFACLILYGSASCFLFSAITLQTSTTQVRFDITQTTESPKENGTLPVCDLALVAKQKGRGTVTVAHSPLSDGNSIVGYSLFYEEKGALKPMDKTGFHYSASPESLQVVHITKLWARIERPLEGAPEDYESNVAFNLVLDT